MNTSFGYHTRVVSMSYICCNSVLSAVSCYNFSKITCATVSYVCSC